MLPVYLLPPWLILFALYYTKSQPHQIDSGEHFYDFLFCIFVLERKEIRHERQKSSYHANVVDTSEWKKSTIS